MENRVYLSPPHLGTLEARFLGESLASNWITTLGPQVEAFEKELADYAGSPFAVALSSGTAGIHLGLKALGVKRGDIVLCSSLTFAASANPIVYEGAEPVFIDSEIESWNISPKALEQAILELRKEGKSPKALVVVNLYGQSANFDPILELCKHHKIAVLEDAAESLGATYRGQKSGMLGDIGIYSFNGNKIITTSGGGAVVSRNEEFIKKIQFLGHQARDPFAHYEHSDIGYNYRLSNLLAAIGRGQLRVLEERVQQRRSIFDRYQEALKDIEGVRFIPENEWGRSTRWLSAFTMTPRKNLQPADIIRVLEQKNIEARHVWKPMHRQPVFRNMRYFSNDQTISHSDFLFEWGVVLPSGSQMTETVQDQVISTLSSVLKGA